MIVLIDWFCFIHGIFQSSLCCRPQVGPIWYRPHEPCYLGGVLQRKLLATACAPTRCILHPFSNKRHKGHSKLLKINLTVVWWYKRDLKENTQWFSILNTVSLWSVNSVNGSHIKMGNDNKAFREQDPSAPILDQWMNSPFMGQQVGNCKSFTSTHYLADLFAMHCDPRASPLWIRHCIRRTSLLFQIDQPSHS